MTLSDLGTAVVVGRPWPVEDVSDRSLPTRGFLPRTPQLGLAAPLLIEATVRPLEPMSILALPNACCRSAFSAGGMPTMKFWLLRPKGFSYHYTDTESCWGCVVRAPDRETALALAATSELRLGDDFPDGWDVTEVPVDGPPAVIMFDY